MPDHVNNYVFYVTIKVINRSTRDSIAFLEWQDMSFDLRLKWDWYFTYRAALLQVKFPRSIVTLNSGKTIPTGTRLEIAFKNRLRAKKGKITETYNKLEKAKKEWNSLFPIEDEPLYKRALSKLKRLHEELAEFRKEAQCNS